MRSSPRAGSTRPAARRQEIRAQTPPPIPKADAQQGQGERRLPDQPLRPRPATDCSCLGPGLSSVPGSAQTPPDLRPIPGQHGREQTVRCTSKKNPLIVGRRHVAIKGGETCYLIGQVERLAGGSRCGQSRGPYSPPCKGTHPQSCNTRAAGTEQSSAWVCTVSKGAVRPVDFCVGHPHARPRRRDSIQSQPAI